MGRVIFVGKQHSAKSRSRSILGGMQAVIAALGASLLTVLGSFWLTRQQAGLRRREAGERERAKAYGDLLTRSLEILMRVRAVGEVMRLRSSARRPGDLSFQGAGQFGLLEVLNWIAPALEPFADAWSRVSAAGSQEAVDAGCDLVRAVYDLLSTAVSPVAERGWLMPFLGGNPWSGGQCATYEAAVDGVIASRKGLTEVLRGEFGAPSARLPDHPRFTPSQGPGLPVRTGSGDGIARAAGRPLFTVYVL
jgi:hypothetical protein